MARVSFGSCGTVPEGSTWVGRVLPSPEIVGELKQTPSDVGASTMIIDGQIKVKSGPKLLGFDETSALFDDGSKVEADVVIFATG